MIHVEKNKIYANNTVNETVVKAATQLLECFDEIKVSFDVEGRTLHQCLAHELYSKLDTNTYGAEIDYMTYKCRIFKRPTIKLVTIEVHYVDRHGNNLMHHIKHGFTKPESTEQMIKSVLFAKPDLKQILGELYQEGDQFERYGNISVESVMLD
jgi:hypothetical protein